MKERRTAGDDVISILDELIQEGLITSAKARVSAKPNERPEIEVSVPQNLTVAEALHEVRRALDPLGLDLTIVARLGGSAGGPR